MNDDLLSLKLYVDDKGEVWYLNGAGSPTASGQSVIGFLLRPLCQEMPRLRIMGLPQNMQLIMALYIQRTQTSYGSVEVCGPAACKTAQARKDPCAALYAMRTYGHAASLGGWHKMRPDDYLHFALASQLHKVGRVDKVAQAIYHKHPAWMLLTFIPHLREDATIRLLNEIVDPRWFINPVNPTRGSRLRRFLGLDLKTMLGVCGEGKPQRYHARCKLVLDAWTGSHNAKMIERPDHFLWRIKRASLEKHNNTALGNLRASQAFVEYLRLCWLATLGRGRHQLEALFVPEYFFQERYEAKAFYDHIKKTAGAAK
jgi:hypothetical protein